MQHCSCTTTTIAPMPGSGPDGQAPLRGALVIMLRSLASQVAANDWSSLCADPARRCPRSQAAVQSKRLYTAQPPCAPACWQPCVTPGRLAVGALLQKVLTARLHWRTGDLRQANTLPQEPLPDTPPMRAAGRAQWEQQAVRLARLCCWVLQAVPHRHQATSGSMQTPCLACLTRHSAARLLQQLLQPSSRPASWPGERTWFG